MRFEELKKKLKQAQDIKISFQEFDNNEFIATIKGIINSMENKKKEPTNKEILLTILSRLDKVESRLDNIDYILDNLEKDVGELKIKVDNIETDVAMLKREAIRHGWDLNSNK